MAFQRGQKIALRRGAQSWTFGSYSGKWCMRPGEVYTVAVFEPGTYALTGEAVAPNCTVLQLVERPADCAYSASLFRPVRPISIAWAHAILRRASAGVAASNIDRWRR